ncbi:MAG: hypothetical protein JO069_10120 [Verrucomicrobia bacterium]|nr:hypothetical protein [Verrucomicrobiota bacterium]
MLVVIVTLKSSRIEQAVKRRSGMSPAREDLARESRETVRADNTIRRRQV